MPNLYIGVNKGGELKDVVTSASTTSKDIEINVNTSNVAVGDKQSIVNALEYIQSFLIQNALP